MAPVEVELELEVVVVVDSRGERPLNEGAGGRGLMSKTRHKEEEEEALVSNLINELPWQLICSCWNLLLLLLLLLTHPGQANRTSGEPAIIHGECGSSFVTDNGIATRSFHYNNNSNYKNSYNYNYSNKELQTGSYEDQASEDHESPIDVRLMRLRQEGVDVRLEFVVDQTFMLHMERNQTLIKEYIWSLIYNLQLFYERSELSSVIKFSFSVSEIRYSNNQYFNHEDVDHLLHQFSYGPDFHGTGSRYGADISILLVYRNLWLRKQVASNNSRFKKILGISYVGTFCHERAMAAMVLNGYALGCWAVLAHELGHAFSAEHDGNESNEFARDCGSGYIMNAQFRTDSLIWSSCTIAAFRDFFLKPEIWRCIYAQERITREAAAGEQQEMRAASNLVKLSNGMAFNFGNSLVSNKRVRLAKPADLFTLDGQCKIALGKLARFSKQALTYCTSLECELGLEGQQSMSVNIGPALDGSKCKSPTTTTMDDESANGATLVTTNITSSASSTSSWAGTIGRQDRPFGRCQMQECLASGLD